MEKKSTATRAASESLVLGRSRRNASGAPPLRDTTIESPTDRIAQRLSGEVRGGESAPPFLVPQLGDGLSKASILGRMNSLSGMYLRESTSAVTLEMPGT